jgi:hypothetical protein
VRIDGTVVRIAGMLVKIAGTRVTIATKRGMGTGMRPDITDATIAVMLRAGWGETIASTADRTTAITAIATTVLPA